MAEVRAEHEFGRAAADVGDEEWPVISSGGQFRGRPGERQHRLLGPGEDLGRNAKHLLDQADEIGRVIGVPGGARRHHAHGLRTRTGDDVRVVAQHGDGPRERLRRQPPGLVYPLTEPDDLHPAGHVGQFGAVRIYVGQQQPQRIGPAVHGGYPADHQVSPTTHGPASHHSPTASSASRPNGFTPPAASS